MDCVNHQGTTATAYCQNCGKALCAACVRHAAAGQLLCEPCSKVWQSYQPPFTQPQSAGPRPPVAGVVGLIPGVGAMYNGQFFKAMIHVVIFAVLVSIAHHYHIFGLFVAAWIFYQAFEAFHTAKARLEGQPLPDPFGLNELANWLNLNRTSQNPQAWKYPPQPGAPPYNPTAGTAQQPPYAAGAQPGGWQPYTGPNPPPYAPGFPDPNLPQPFCWPKRTPFLAIALIGLGLLFLLDRFDFFSHRVFEFSWPLGLIALGVWLAIRRVGNSQGGSR